MSDTPKTDSKAAKAWLFGNDDEVVESNLARELERENTSLHARNLELSRLIVELPDRIKAELDRRSL